MTTTPPEPVADPSSYARRGYDDRQADGMDAEDGRAVASRNAADTGSGAPSDADRVEADPPAE